MVEAENSVVERMRSLVQQWQATSDQRFIFLSCYQTMTENMLDALTRRQFKDSAWTNLLLTRFAGYYFVALEAYEQNPPVAPAAWRVAFDAARSPKSMALQNLLLGVNAHINYDLVLALAELLKPEWQALAESRRGDRYFDFCYVNEVIGRTIDSVQDDILERAVPALDLVDRLMGPVDEWIISRTINQWREEVWANTLLVLAAKDSSETSCLIRQIEDGALRRARAIQLADWRAVISEIF